MEKFKVDETSYCSNFTKESNILGNVSFDVNYLAENSKILTEDEQTKLYEIASFMRELSKNLAFRK